MSVSLLPRDSEWLDADVLGGFANGTVASIRTRCSEALPLTSETLPAGCLSLVSGFSAWVETPRGTFAIPLHRHVPDVIRPDGVARVESFTREPWPCWTWRLTDDLAIEQEVFAVHGKSAVFVAWKLIGEAHGSMILKARPFISIRDLHGRQHENGALWVESSESFEHVLWRPYGGAAGVVTRSNGHYHHDPAYYRSFLSGEDAVHGLGVAAPGTFHWNLAAKPAVWLFAPEGQRLNHLESTEDLYVMTRRAERSRSEAFSAPHNSQQ
jgi:predicted glycogen debranching enzyme